MAEGSFPHLSAPLAIGSLTIKNRIIMAPMDTGFGNNDWGGFTPEGVEYFVRRAEGGFGLLTSGGTAADADGVLAHAEEFVQAARPMNERIREQGSAMFLQVSAGLGRNAGLKTPSPVPPLEASGTGRLTQELTQAEIHDLVGRMGRTAALAREAGFAGVDVHALHWGHLLDTFALAITNHRTDEYGGTLENRLRIAQEIREAMAREAGPDFPVTMRLAVKSYLKGLDQASFTGTDEAGRTVEEAVAIARLLEGYGYDGLSLDTGMLDSFYYALPPSYVAEGFATEMYAQVKQAVSIPVLAGGRMANPYLSEAAIAEGKIDAIVVGRQAIADPDYAAKVVAGAVEDVRPCIGCNQGCIWGYSTKGRVGCAVNPHVGHEADERRQATEPKRVVVVGGGVAGMEAALEAKAAGHEVTLLEKGDHLGGNLVPAGAHDFKVEVARLNASLAHQLDVQGIDVLMGTEGTADVVAALKPDVAIVATGSVPLMPRSIPGIDHPKAVSGVDALLGRVEVGRRVVVVGGGLVGCEVALGFAREGREVTVVEALDALMPGDVPNMNRSYVLDAFAHYGVETLTSTRLEAIDDAGAQVSADGTARTIEADTVVVCLGYRPVPSCAEELRGRGIRTMEIGDGRQVGNILTCVADAHQAVRGI